MSASQVTHASHEHVDPLKSYLVVFFVLLMLLVVTVLAYHIPFDTMFGEQWGFLNTALALLIATVKAGLVVLIFMHLRHGTKLTWVIAGAGFMWLCIMITFFFADYLTRASIPENAPELNNPAIPQVVHHNAPTFNGLG
jgi:cytochrome c oxidase subunit 4